MSLAPLIYAHLKSESASSSIIIDAKAALDFDGNNQWKYVGAKANSYELGKPVSVTAYERVEWPLRCQG